MTSAGRRRSPAANRSYRTARTSPAIHSVRTLIGVQWGSLDTRVFWECN